MNLPISVAQLRDYLRLSRAYRRSPSGVPSPDPSAVDTAARMFIVEAVGGASLTAAIVFNAVYAVRLGATNAEIGLLASLPPLMVVLLTIPLGRLVERLADMVGFSSWMILVHRLLYLLVVLLPLAPEHLRPELLVLIVVMVSVPMAAFGLSFTSLLADVIPEKRRAAVVSWRQIMLAIGSLVLVPIAGRWLDLAPFPLNYQVLYAVALGWGLVGFWAIRRVKIAPRVVTPSARPAGRPRLAIDLGQVRQTVLAQRGFALIVVDTFVHGMGTWLAAPLYVLLFVRQMGASDGWFGLLTAIAGGATAVGYYLWQRLLPRTGDRRTLIVSVTLTGLYPVLVGLAPSLEIVLGLALLNGLIAPALGLSHFNTLIRVCPADRRPTYLAIYTVTMNAGAFVAPLISVAVADQIGIRPVLIFAGLLWMSSGLLFWRLSPERHPHPAPRRAPA